MNDLSNLALGVTNNLRIVHEGDVHDGKVRSVYWLSPQESRRLIELKNYRVHPDALLGVMVISDRISAFDVIWHGVNGLQGIPGKGAALNAIALHWFKEFEKAGIGNHHVLDAPHPLAWIVQRTEPIMVEAVARQYITGSMWRDYAKGIREICSIQLPPGLKEYQRLDELLLTPTTKGVLKDIPGVKEADDTNVSREQLIEHFEQFKFRSPDDVPIYEEKLVRGWKVIDAGYAKIGNLFVDTKFEFGYITMPDGQVVMIYQDEVGTPDSSRTWIAERYAKGEVVEESKEPFRQHLMSVFGEEVFTDKTKMPERRVLAKYYNVPLETMMVTSTTYTGLAERLTGEKVKMTERPREEIHDALAPYGLVR
jgi:phosphoribosylaminoimidazole-succinocarboxamide synthase